MRTLLLLFLSLCLANGATASSGDSTTASPQQGRIIHDTTDPLTILPPMRSANAGSITAEVPLRNVVQAHGTCFAIVGPDPYGTLWVLEPGTSWQMVYMLALNGITFTGLVADSASGDVWGLGTKWPADGTSSAVDVWVRLCPGMNGYNSNTRWFEKNEPKEYVDFRKRLH